VPLPADLRARLRDPDFWREYFFEAEPGEEKEYVEHTAEFPVGDGYALTLGINDHAIHLDLRTPDDTETVTLGWDDQAHWMPDALRWTELDLIGRAVAVTDPELRHPGPVLSLAGRLVVLDGTDDLDRITPMMDVAFGPAPEPVWWPSTRNWLRKADGRHDGITWAEHDGDWKVDQVRDGGVDCYLHSLRCDGGDFPFAAWRGLLAAAERTVGGGPLPTPVTPAEQGWTDEERTGAPRGSLIAARFGASPLRNFRRYHLDLELAAQGRQRTFAIPIRDDLDRALREADLGWAEISGGVSSVDGTPISTHFTVGVLDGLDEAIALISKVLRRHDIAADARLTHRRTPIPLS
jgi:hypothetical protein